MSYVLRLDDDADRQLVVAAMRAAADRATSVATTAAASLRAMRQEGKDVRSRSLKVTDLLADAEELRGFALTLERAEPEQDAPAPPAPLVGAPAADPPHPPSGDSDDELTVPLSDETAHLPDVETLDEEAPARPAPAPPRGPTPDGDPAPTGTAGALARTLANVDAAIARHDQGANP